MKRSRVVGATILTVAAVAVVVPWAGRFRADAGVPTLTVKRAPFERRVVAEGNLEAAQATPVTAPMEAQGQLKVAWLVPDGSRVKRDDVLVRFDPTEMERSLRDGESDQASADSRISGTKADTGGTIKNLERDADLARKELEAADHYKVDDPDVFSRQEIIRSEIDRTLAQQRIETSDDVRTIRQGVAQVDLALLDIERRKAGLAIDRAKKGLDALEIKAPHDGILVYKRNWRGEVAKVGDTLWPGQPVAEIPELTTLQAQVYVLEADAGGLSPGLPATVVVEAHPEKEFAASIKKVDTLAKRRTGWIPVQYFGTTLSLASTDPSLMKPGQRVRAVLALDRNDAAISVPRNAVFEKDGKPIVYRRRHGSFAAVPVTLGPAAVGRVVVAQGLDEGDEVALRDPESGAREEAPVTSGGSPTAIGGGS
ncbi:MAG TPA: efflux RND transporter periplasmic adaptor subunit [Candidatus Polarisedimenticolaceae bacterium]|nr:efflux RND transporter periplasmic adaptor subunit [Candidatus Polarisedimenticolaceae bacterium]